MADTLKQRQFVALKREVLKGIEALEYGRYRTYNDTTLRELTEDICLSGRKRLKAAAQARGKKYI
jgi:hypothetical protein